MAHAQLLVRLVQQVCPGCQGRCCHTLCPNVLKVNEHSTTRRIGCAGPQPAAAEPAAPAPAPPPPAGGAAAPPPGAGSGTGWPGPDESAPVTSIQLRLADGSRLVARFNLTQVLTGGQLAAV